MKTILLVLPVAILLVGAGCDAGSTSRPNTVDQTQPAPQSQTTQGKQQPEPQPPLAPVPTPTQTLPNSIPTGRTQTSRTYTNPSYGIRFSYPSTWQIHDAADTSIMQYYHFPQKATGLDNSLVITSVSMPTSAYPHSNLSKAYATIAVNNGIDDLGVCLQIPVRQTTGTVTFNNIIYSIATDSGVSAGTSQTSRIYHASFKGRCYEINLNVFTIEVSNYQGPGQLAAIDEQQLLSELEVVVKSFTFGS